MSIESTTEFPAPDHQSEIGNLCAGWSFFELVTDIVMWGVLGVDPKVGAIISEYKDLQGRWKVILSHAEPVVSSDEFATFKRISSALVDVARDRNIIVHGQLLLMPPDPQVYAVITRGASAGKRHPVNKHAVDTVLNNIQKLAAAAFQIAQAHNWPSPPAPPMVVTDWAKPIAGFS